MIEREGKHLQKPMSTILIEGQRESEAREIDRGREETP